MTPVALRAMVDYIMERDARIVGKTVVGDKSPNMKTGGQAIAEMRLIYPDAQVINMVRDGRDVLLSHRFQAFIDKPELLNREDTPYSGCGCSRFSSLFTRRTFIISRSTAARESSRLGAKCSRDGPGWSTAVW